MEHFVFSARMAAADGFAGVSNEGLLMMKTNGH
jgi:hypothetical protein